MKIILLRHEERDLKKPFFFTSLTKKGIYNSNTIILNKLNILEIHKIYSSPFLRCIQTIQPYCSINNREINIENSLYEFMHNNKFRSTHLYNLNDINLKIKNNNYSSSLN
jgi:phosphohistidine phosphatase SixA